MVEVREELSSLSRALGDHLDRITQCMDEIRHAENQQACMIQLLEARQQMESEHEEEDPSRYVF